MKNDTLAAMEEVCETLMNYICDPRKGSGPQDKAIQALVELRNALQTEEATDEQKQSLDTNQPAR